MRVLRQLAALLSCPEVPRGRSLSGARLLLLMMEAAVGGAPVKTEGIHRLLGCSSSAARRMLDRWRVAGLIRVHDGADRRGRRTGIVVPSGRLRRRISALAASIM